MQRNNSLKRKFQKNYFYFKKVSKNFAFRKIKPNFELLRHTNSHSSLTYR